MIADPTVLCSDDVVLIREGFSLSKILAKEENRQCIRAEVHFWSTYEKLAQLLKYIAAFTD